MMDNPNVFEITSDFASSGNDNAVSIITSVPAHTIPINGETVFTNTAPAPSAYQGKQIRALITTSFTGSKNVPSPTMVCIVPITFSGGSGSTYAFIDTTRITSGDVQLRVRVINTIFPAAVINIPAFTVSGIIRTIVAN